MLRLFVTTLKLLWVTCDPVSDLLFLILWQAAGMWWCAVLLLLYHYSQALTKRKKMQSLYTVITMCLNHLNWPGPLMYRDPSLTHKPSYITVLRVMPDSLLASFGYQQSTQQRVGFETKPDLWIEGAALWHINIPCYSQCHQCCFLLAAQRWDTDPETSFSLR